jgi:Transmembrane secretion effector
MDRAGATASEAPGEPHSVLRHRPFALFRCARIASILAFQMLAVGWQLYALTGRALDLGLLGLAQFLPMVVLTLLVGHVADRYPHRSILMTCQLAARSRCWAPPTWSVW